MANDEPPYLTVGTDVSAKYKGAFCEAKIKKVNRVVKCKVTFKNNLGSFIVTDDLIKGSLRMGADIEAKHPEKNQFLDAVINKLQDYSQYTVVFDDGDETTLRRTSLCLKSGRHFAESPTLDQFPLTNPEHFGTPVIGTGKFKRKRRSTMNSSLDYESSDDDSFPRKLKAIRGKERDPDLGRVVAVDYGDRRKKDSWYPGLIVPHPAQSNIKISKEEHLIRSFKDGKYYQVPKKDTREFLKDNLPKIENNALKIAVDKAILYLEKDELPTHWDKVLFMGLENASAEEDSPDSDADTSDDEPSEDKDRFVAQLYKFMDERGTPINKAPSVCNQDLNLYKLFKIMHKLGGFNKVTNQNKWKVVYSKMGLPQSNANGPNQIKSAYKRYLQSFEDFYRKLGCTMVNNSRSTRGRHRSDRNFIITRTRDRDTASPKGRKDKDKATPDKKTEDKPRINEKKDAKVEDSSSKVEDKVTKTPDKKKLEKARPDEKEEKQKKEERPRLVRSQSLNKDKKSSSFKDEDKKDVKPEKARTREDARKEKNESPEKKGTRSSVKMDMEKKEKEEAKDKKDQSPSKKIEKEKPPKDAKEDKLKDKKEDKVLKDRKLIKEKKVEEKPENPPEKKKEEKLLREKRDSSKELKEDKAVKGRKEDLKNQEEKSPLKKKLDRLAKEKKEEKLFRPRRENKSPLPDNKKAPDMNDNKNKEDKLKNDLELKKEEKTGPKLRERREDTPFSEIDENTETSDDKDTTSQDGYEKKGPGARLKEEHDEPPNKGKKRSLKLHDRDEKDLGDASSDSDDNDQDKEPKDENFEIELGDRVKVKYGRGRLKKVYDAKVLKIQTDGTEKRYFVHYNGWNNRYDEWVRRNFIVSLVNADKQNGKETTPKASLQTEKMKKIDRGRPPGPISKPVRKNSTSSTNSSVSCSRATRSDKKNLQSSPLSSGLEPKKRTRKKSGIVGLTDTSKDSDSDGEENLDLDDDDVGDADVEDNANTQNDSCFKEELFSDDEEKEKLEDVKREDIMELEKAICIEETPEDAKDPFFNPIKTDLLATETFLKVELKPEPSDPVADSSKENEKSVTKTEIEITKEPSLEISSAKINEKQCEVKLQQIDKAIEGEKKFPVSETPVTLDLSKNIKPAKSVPNLVSQPEIQCEKSPFIPIPSKFSLLSGESSFLESSFKPLTGDPSKQKCNLKSTIGESSSLTTSFSPSSLLGSDSKSLSFAGLHGLIQKNSFEKNLSLSKNIMKNPCMKQDTAKVVLKRSAPPKIDLKPNPESKSSITSSLFRPEKIMPLFGSSILTPPKLSEPLKNEDKPVLKTNVFSFAKKPKDDKDRSKDLKIHDSTLKLPHKDISKDKPEQKAENSRNTKSIELPPKKAESLFKKCVFSPPRFTTSNIDTELKPGKIKDGFDLLAESTLSALKKPEIKDNAFSLSFSNVVPKGKYMPDQPYNKILCADNLHSPKLTETVELNKAAPTISETSVKKEAGELKETELPTSRKEELSFNFLQGCQETTKSLSRSESSNSLRICEDMSDTNDSNTDSKDLVINNKLCTPTVVPSTVSDNAVSCANENDIPQTDIPKLPVTESAKITVEETTQNSSKMSDSKDGEKSVLKTPIITVSLIRSSPVPAVIPSEEKKEVSDIEEIQPKEVPPEDIPKETEKKAESKIEPPIVKEDDNPKTDPVEEKEIESKLECLSSSVDKESKTESLTESKTESLTESKTESLTESNNEESSNSTKSEKTITSNKKEKDFVFDDLLKIKSSNPNFNQSSVIMWNPEMKVNSEEKLCETVDVKTTSVSEEIKTPQEVEQPVGSSAEVSSASPLDESNTSDKVEDDEFDSSNNNEKSDPDDNENLEDEGDSLLLTKKEIRKKKLGKKLKKFGNADGFEKEDKETKLKDGKNKTKKRKLENEDSADTKLKSKKIKKNKNKKRLIKHEELQGLLQNEHKKTDLEDDNKDIVDKMKRKEKRKNEKKFLKSGIRAEFLESKFELKKKKGKKYKLAGERKDFLEKKTKKKKKILTIDDNQDTDSDKDSPLNKLMDRKKKKDKKKFKAKDSSSSDDAGDKFFKDQSKNLPNLPSSSNTLLRQDSKSDDPDMSFLLCEEKVPASPVGIINMGDDTSGSSSIEGNRAIDILPLPNVYPCLGNIEASAAVNKHSIDTSAVLDNTPPTTPSSTESLLSSSSPSHERDSFSMNYPESTQSGRDSAEGESDIFRCNNSNRTIVRGSEEYHAATTLAFAVCKSVSEKPKEEQPHSFLKRQKSEIDEHSPIKRKKKSKRIRRNSESAKSPRHKSSLSRLSKIEGFCEDSSGASPAASSSPPYSNISMNFSRSPHRSFSSSSEGFSRHNFYVPLHEKDPEKRIALLQNKMAALRKEYMELRAKVIAIDHKKRRARKKIREAGAANANPSAQSEEGQNCS